jgi:hypothetical protein
MNHYEAIAAAQAPCYRRRDVLIEKQLEHFNALPLSRQ